METWLELHGRVRKTGVRVVDPSLAAGGLQRLLAPIALPDLMRPVGRIRSASYHPRDGVYSLIFSVPRGKWWVRGGGVWQAGGGGEIRVDGAVAFLKFSDQRVTPPYLA